MSYRPESPRHEAEDLKPWEAWTFSILIIIVLPIALVMFGGILGGSH